MNPIPFFYYLLSFQSGFAIMAVEMTMARALAPFFGTSAFIWAVVIASVMTAIFLGNLHGGRMADRGAGIPALCNRLMVATILVGVTSQATTLALYFSFSQLPDNIRLIGLLMFLAVAVLAVPIYLFAQTSPWLIGRHVADGNLAGGVSGKIYGASTAGGLLGTFLPVLFGVPLIGIRLTFAAISLLLASGTVFVLWRFRCYRGLCVGLLALSLTIPLYFIPARSPTSTVFQTESLYNSIWVDRDAQAVNLRVNDRKAIQSRSYIDRTVLPADVWGMYLTAPFLCTARPHYHVLFLGLGAGSAASYYHRYYPEAELTGVEIDEKIIDVGRRFFGLKDIPIRIFNEDARTFVERSKEQWDVIVVDAFIFPYLPAHLSTVEFMAGLKTHLRPGGVILMNVGHYKQFDEIVDAIATTGGSVFPHVYLFRMPRRMNTLVFLMDHALEERQATEPSTAIALRLLSGRVERHLIKADMNPLLTSTDDRPLTEWLTHRIILQAFGIL